MKSKIAMLAALVLCIMADTWVDAGSVTLDFSDLPSTQGWTYGGNFTYYSGDTSESQFFSVNSGVLHQDTVTNESANGTTNWHRAPSVAYAYTGPELAADGFFDIQVRARVTDYSMSDYASIGHPETCNAGGFLFGMIGLGSMATVEMTDSHINVEPPTDAENWVYPNLFTGDNTGYHDYRMIGSLTTSFTVYRDGVNLGTYNVHRWMDGVTYMGTPPTLILGDGTNGGNAIVDIAAYSYISVPEPATLAFIALGSLLIRKK